MDLNTTTLQKAAEIIAPQLGLNLPRDYAEAVKAVNKYRNLLYNLYSDVKLFDHYKACLPIQKFHQKCTDTCQTNFYYGVTLPTYMAGVIGAWEYNAPLTLRSRWREIHAGIETGSSRRHDLVEMPETSPTERVLTSPSVLRIFTQSEEDDGKEVTIYGKDTLNNPRVITFKLQFDTIVQSDFEFSEIDEVVLPALCGAIELKNSEGCDLSVYYPHEHIPRYRRFKLNAPCGATHLLVQGSRRYEDLALPTDVVEIGDRLIIEAAGRYFRYSEDTTDTEDLRRAAYDLNNMKTLLNGAIARHRGRSLQDGTPTRRPNRRKIRKGLS